MKSILFLTISAISLLLANKDLNVIAHAGKGIEIDSIFIDIGTPENSLLYKLGIQPKESFIIVTSCGEIEGGGSFSETEKMQKYEFESITFELYEKEDFTMELRNIEINMSDSIYLSIDGKVYDSNSKINLKPYLYSISEFDYIAPDSLYYQFDSKGISFYLRESSKGKTIEKISIYPKRKK